jgi:hypothetical protein
VLFVAVRNQQPGSIFNLNSKLKLARRAGGAPRHVAFKLASSRATLFCF